MIGLALSELGLLATKQSIYKTICAGETSKAAFSDKDLAVLFERALDLDANLLLIAFKECSQ